jgi:putative NIF3 family GTP cyclohydrolase 1 type 2
VARRDDIVRFANELLDIESYPEYGRPGLQVTGADEVSKLVCGVSSSRELFERAGAAGAQFVVVHHGIFWRNEPLVIDRRLKGTLRRTASRSSSPRDLSGSRASQWSPAAAARDCSKRRTRDTTPW